MVRFRGGKVPAPHARLRHNQRLPTVNRHPPPVEDSSMLCASTTIIDDAPSPCTSTADSIDFDKCTSKVSNTPAAKRPAPWTTLPDISEATAGFVQESTRNLGRVVANAFIKTLKQADMNSLPHMEQAAESVYSSIQQLGGDSSNLKKVLDPIFELCHQYLETKRICSLDIIQEAMYLKDQIKALRPHVVASCTKIQSLEKELREKKTQALRIIKRIDVLRMELVSLEKEKKGLGEKISELEVLLKEKVVALTEAPMVKRALDLSPLEMKDKDTHFQTLLSDQETMLQSKRNFILNMVRNIPE